MRFYSIEWGCICVDAVHDYFFFRFPLGVLRVSKALIDFMLNSNLFTVEQKKVGTKVTGWHILTFLRLSNAGNP